MRSRVLALLAISMFAAPIGAQQPAGRLTLKDIFELEWAADPQISPDGKRVVFVRAGFDIMKDDTRSRSGS